MAYPDQHQISWKSMGFSANPHGFPESLVVVLPYIGLYKAYIRQWPCNRNREQLEVPTIYFWPLKAPNRKIGYVPIEC